MSVCALYHLLEHLSHISKSPAQLPTELSDSRIAPEVENLSLGVGDPNNVTIWSTSVRNVVQSAWKSLQDQGYSFTAGSSHNPASSPLACEELQSFFHSLLSPALSFSFLLRNISQYFITSFAPQGK